MIKIYLINLFITDLFILQFPYSFQPQWLSARTKAQEKIGLNTDTAKDIDVIIYNILYKILFQGSEFLGEH